MYEYLLTGDYRELMKNQTLKQDGGIPADKAFDFIIKLISDWDFTDEEGNKLPVNNESIDMLPAGDLNILSDQINKTVESSTLKDTVKKNIK